MTNYEFYKEKINAILCEGVDIALENCQIDRCGNIDCSRCSFYTSDISSCRRKTYEWLVSEYKEPEEDVDWSKVPVDTPVLVRDTGDMWYKRYFAKYENGRVYTFAMGLTSWTAEGYDHTGFMYAKLANPEDCKSAFHSEEKELTKEERMEQLSAIYKDSCVKSAWKEMVEEVDKFWQSDIDDAKKDKIANMVMMMLKMEE